eukprot:EC097379.1.p1 GENE.EC097379.1~~EC097379.1.p1  ORF type:complete len:196 (+),score=6.12 EC097379.1:111-698(+)
MLLEIFDECVSCEIFKQTIMLSYYHPGYKFLFIKFMMQQIFNQYVILGSNQEQGSIKQNYDITHYFQEYFMVRFCLNSLSFFFFYKNRKQYIQIKTILYSVYIIVCTRLHSQLYQLNLKAYPQQMNMKICQLLQIWTFIICLFIQGQKKYLWYVQQKARNMKKIKRTITINIYYQLQNWQLIGCKVIGVLFQNNE